MSFRSQSLYRFAYTPFSSKTQTRKVRKKGGEGEGRRDSGEKGRNTTDIKMWKTKEHKKKVSVSKLGKTDGRKSTLNEYFDKSEKGNKAINSRALLIVFFTFIFSN